jgi:hypothetical protein
MLVTLLFILIVSYILGCCVWLMFEKFAAQNEAAADDNGEVIDKTEEKDDGDKAAETGSPAKK